MTHPPASRRHLALLALTLCTLLINGYHPLTEDGGLYAAGIQSALNPALFPHDLAFATATGHYSVFAPLMAQTIRLTHIPLPWLLLIADLAGAWIFLHAAWRIAAQSLPSERAAFYATALLAAWFTLPIAGTSLLLMDPYVTARTFSTLLSLLALSFALERRPLPCALALAAAAAFHPLMAAYAAALILTLLIAKLPSRSQTIGYISLTIAALGLATALQLNAPTESPQTVAAAISRYYWFLSQWHWFELLGLLGPLLVLAALLRFANLTPAAKALCRAAIALGLIANLISLLFAHEHYTTHLVARLQPLRAFLLIYAVMTILLGVALTHACPRRYRIIPPVALTIIATGMTFAATQSISASSHLELPWRTTTNPWVQSFEWARANTPTDALFALDADYITTHGEDAQTFRATAQRSMLPDFSKDGGEAAIRPTLAADWFAGMTAQQHLSLLTPEERKQHLAPLGVTWLILHTDAKTNGVCPYANAVVKVCPLSP